MAACACPESARAKTLKPHRPTAASPTCAHSALGRQQLRVRSALDDPARFHDQDFVGVHHGGEAVRDHQRGLAARHAAQFGLDGALVGGIEGGGGLVEHQDGGS